MKFALKDIQPNPFRMLGRYPTVRSKVEKLKKSIEKNTFWENLLGRLVDNKPELAYGHHRHLALLELYGPNHKIELNIRELSDARMLQIMAEENDSDYAHNFSIVLESVRAVVQALGAAKITPEEMRLDPKTRKDNLRYAPSFLMGVSAPLDGAHPYTIDSIGSFLNWTRPDGRALPKVSAVIGVLELIERYPDTVNEEMFHDLSVEKIQAMVADINGRRKEVRKELAQAAAKEQQFRDVQLELDKQRKKQEEKENAELDKRAKDIAAAKQEENTKRAKQLTEQMKAEQERAAERANKFAEERKKLDDKVAAAHAKYEEERKVDEYLPIRHMVTSLLGELDTITEGRLSLYTRIKALSKNNKVSLKDRDRLWEATQKAGEWFLKQSGAFKIKVDTPAQEVNKLKAKDKAKEKK